MQDGGAQARHGSVSASASAPSISTSVSAKRPLPTSATDPGSSSKRVRSSPSSAPASASAPDADSPSGTGSGPARPRRGGPSQTRGQSRGTPAPGGNSTSTSTSNAANGSVSGGANGKGTLLSPSQKRANHIQSEQKRRANIRRGYESLCEVVPALREAIRAEDERERAKVRELDGLEDGDGKGSGSSRTRGGGGGEKGKKKKGRGETEKPDGRAGPRSENVVLQKSAYALLVAYCYLCSALRVTPTSFYFLVLGFVPHLFYLASEVFLCSCPSSHQRSTTSPTSLPTGARCSSAWSLLGACFPSGTQRCRLNWVTWTRLACPYGSANGAGAWTLTSRISEALQKTMEAKTRDDENTRLQWFEGCRILFCCAGGI